MSTPSPTSSNNDSTGCQEPVITTATWVLLGVFLALAFFSKVLTLLLFKAISGALKNLKALSFDRPFRNLFMRPVTYLLFFLFLQFAWAVAPWICALDWLRRFIGFLILACALTVLLVLIGRVFDFAEIFIKYFEIEHFYLVPLREGIRVAKLAALFFVGLLFFSITVLRIDPNNQFRVDLFFSAFNVISMTYLLFFVPVVRDVVGGLFLISDRPFQLHDWLEIGDIRGTVERVGLFAIVVRTVNGGKTLIANSRFVDSVYTIYPAVRRRVASFKFPIPKQKKGVSDEAHRSFLASVEQVLRRMDVRDIYVTYAFNEADQDYLDIRFVTSEVSTVEEQIATLNDALIKITSTLPHPLPLDDRPSV